jgi:hypothetical protein
MKLPLRRIVVSLTLSTLCLGLVSCASGPTYAEVKSKLPPIPKGEGRVFVYRPQTIGFGVKPNVKIDSKVVGTSEGRGFLYSDQLPGNHELSIATEWKHSSNFNIAAGKPSFVQCTILPGVFVGHIISEQVDAAKGEAEIQQCKMKGK